MCDRGNSPAGIPAVAHARISYSIAVDSFDHGSLVTSRMCLPFALIRKSKNAKLLCSNASTTRQARKILVVSWRGVLACRNGASSSEGKVPVAEQKKPLLPRRTFVAASEASPVVCPVLHHVRVLVRTTRDPLLRPLFGVDWKIHIVTLAARVVFMFRCRECRMSNTLCTLQRHNPKICLGYYTLGSPPLEREQSGRTKGNAYSVGSHS